MAYDLYVITDEGVGHGLSHARIAQRAVAGGADVIQLRDKRLSGRDLSPRPLPSARSPMTPARSSS